MQWLQNNFNGLLNAEKRRLLNNVRIKRVVKEIQRPKASIYNRL